MGIREFFLGPRKTGSDGVTKRLPELLPNDLNLDASATIVNSWYEAGGVLDETDVDSFEELAKNSEKQAGLSEKTRVAVGKIAKNETIIVGNYLEAKKAAEGSQHAQSLLRAKGERQSALLQETSVRALAAIAQIGEGLRE